MKPTRFYGPSPSAREPLERAFGHKPLATEQEDSPLSSCELPALELVVNTVQRSPAKRWSAAAAMRSAMFGPAPTQGNDVRRARG